VVVKNLNNPLNYTCSVPEKKREQLLIALKEGPKRFTDLLRITGLSNMGLTKALRDFIEEGLVAKLPSGEYVLTEKGKAMVAKMALSEVLEKLILEKGAEAVEAELRLLREVDELERYYSLQYLYAAASFIERAARDQPILHARINFLLHLLENHIKRWDILYKSATDLVWRLDPPLPPAPANEEKRREWEKKLREKSTIEYKLEKAESALRLVKLDALTEAERKLALELSSLYEELKKTLQPS
jgi:DNA-binding HxlR family transcriptional regulator